MKHIENLTRELESRGINIGIEEIEVVKNSIPCIGIRIIRPESPDFCPIVYYSQADTLETLIDKIETVLHEKAPDFNLNAINDPKYFSTHAYLAVVKRFGEKDDVLTRHYLNLDIIIKLRVVGDMEEETVGSIKVTRQLLANLDIPESDAWMMAEANTKAAAKIVSMTEALGLPDDGCPLYVASTNYNHDGAAVICFPDCFREFCSSRGIVSLLFIPSSTQEIICITEDDSFSVDNLLELNETVNATQVDPLIQLEPAIYRYSILDNDITIIASNDKEVQ